MMELASPETFVDEGFLNSVLNFSDNNETNNNEASAEINQDIKTDELNTNRVENTSSLISVTQPDVNIRDCPLKESCLICKNMTDKPKPNNW